VFDVPEKQVNTLMAMQLKHSMEELFHLQHE
jgi:hypothetical protein